MEFLEFKTGADDEGRRLDRVLRKFLPEESLPSIYGAIRKGLIKLDGRKARPADKTSANSTLRIAGFLIKDIGKSEKEDGFIRKANPGIQLKTLFQNEHIRVISKPYGIPVQSGSNSMDICRLLRDESKDKDSLSFQPAPLHRLDSRTSGILVCSQGILGATWFSEALRQHEMIRKTYLAVVQGHLAKQAEWRDFIDGSAKKKKGGFLTVQVYEQEKDGAKFAETRAAPLAYGKYQNIDVTLARFQISTGRAHQIRAQSSFHGHPLLGDTAYGGMAAELFGRRHLLHAYEMEFPQGNPVGLPPKITAPLPQDFLLALGLVLIKPDSDIIIEEKADGK